MAGYARLSNNFWQDKDILKLRRKNPSAALLYVMAISWCSDHASDGGIDEDDLLYVLNASDEDVSDLVASGLLLEPSEATEGRYIIRNYLKYQNSAEQIKQTKEKERDKKRRQRGTKRDNSSVPPMSPNVTENVPDVSPRDNSSVPPMSPNVTENVPDVSPRDNSSVPPMSFNQEPITNNQEGFSNENPHPQTPSQTEGADERADEAYPLEFEQFWVTYPRHTGKRKAYQAWRKARRKTNNNLLIAQATRYAADPNREPGYTLTPANWLDGEHWDDDPLPAKPEPTARPSPMPAKTRSQRNLEANMANTWKYMTPAERAEYQRNQGGNDAQQGRGGGNPVAHQLASRQRPMG